MNANQKAIDAYRTSEYLKAMKQRHDSQTREAHAKEAKKCRSACICKVCLA